MKVFYLRYLPPNPSGMGELVSAVSVTDDSTFTLKQWKAEDPELFTREGFYSLMVSSDQQLTVKPEKKEKENESAT